MQRVISVNQELCCHCGLCIKDCIIHALEMNESKIPATTPGKETSCIACQHCLAICPTGALTFGDKKPQNSSPVGYANSDDLLRLIQSRRSMRFYKEENVGQDILDKLTKMLPYIPTGGNADNLFFSIVATRQKMDEIRKCSYKLINSAKDLPPIFTHAKEGFAAGQDIIYRGAPSLIAVAIDKEKTIPGCETADPIIALSYFELYAQSLGLGTVWCDYALQVARHFPEVYELLRIPANYTLDYVILFGLPAVHYTRTIQADMFTINILR